MTVHTPLWRRFFSPPGTRLGWWLLGLLAAHALVMVALGVIGAALSATGLPNMAGHPWLIATTLVVAGAPALARIATGLVAVIERG